MEFRTGHYYLFLPQAAAGRKASLPHFPARAGRRRGLPLGAVAADQMHVITPTFGIGDWDKPGGAELVVDVVREALATLPLDPERVFLMGYSNGAMGVTRAAIKEPGLFKGLVYLSPVTEDELFAAKEFSERKRDQEDSLPARRTRRANSTEPGRGDGWGSETHGLRCPTESLRRRTTTYCFHDRMPCLRDILGVDGRLPRIVAQIVRYGRGVLGFLQIVRLQTTSIFA